jgi:probable rRNA maturation factor
VSNRLTLRNQVRAQPIDLRLLRRILQKLLRDLLGVREWELGIYILGAQEMTRLNETFLRHQGVTDVITFNYAEGPKADPIHGEVVVCVHEARVQAKRFATSWQKELVRYIVHGVLHLQRYKDRRKADRLKMKRRENQLLNQLAHIFPLEALAHPRPQKSH